MYKFLNVVVESGGLAGFVKLASTVGKPLVQIQVLYLCGWQKLLQA